MVLCAYCQSNCGELKGSVTEGALKHKL